MDVRLAVRDESTRAVGGRPDPSVELVRSMLERELEALTTVGPDSNGLRLRVLMRMADRVMATG